MNKKTIVTKNPEFIGMDAALKRAAKAAHNLARKTKTPCYIWKDGQIVDIAARKKSSARSGQASGK
jgi:predicted GNAT family acetyltransferase